MSRWRIAGRAGLLLYACWAAVALVLLAGGTLLVRISAERLAAADARVTALDWASDLEGQLWDNLDRMLAGQGLSPRGLAVLAQAAQAGSVVAFRVFDGTGVSVFESHDREGGPLGAPLVQMLGERAARSVLQGETQVAIQRGPPSPRPSMHATVLHPVKRGDSVVGVIAVTVDQTERLRLFARIIGELKLLLFALFALAIAPFWAIAMLRDRQNRKAEQRIQFLAHHDSLTGLANREQFRVELDRCLEGGTGEASRLALLAIDLDGFKAVNDGLGHAAGDEVLVAVAGRLQRRLREWDLAARLGGDEFAVLLTVTGSARHVQDLAERLVDGLSEPYRLSDGRIALCGASIGIAYGTTREAKAEELLRQADVALYAAKAAGKNQAVAFEATMEAIHRARVSLVAQLRHAIETDGIEVAFQPQYRLVDQKLTGFEALARWVRPGPDGGPVAPDRFIAMAEETGLILPLGRRVLDLSLRAAGFWPESVGVSVNLTARQVQAPGLADDVEQALERSGVAPGRLTLEVTENALIGETGTALASLERLRSLGVRITMDDFGTGASSLSNLWRFPFDGLKIDREFVLSVGRDPRAAGIVDAILGLGRSLGLVVTAEGVESEARVSELDSLGCDQVQGYFTGHPLTAEDATRLAGGPGDRSSEAAA